MLEKLGGIFLLIASVVILVIMGNDILYNTGLIQLAIYTMGVLGLGGAVYTLLKIWCPIWQCLYPVVGCKQDKH
mgnify:CR=1 FL=1